MELSKVKKATIGDLVRTSSCVGEPHVSKFNLVYQFKMV